MHAVRINDGGKMSMENAAVSNTLIIIIQKHVQHKPFRYAICANNNLYSR